jgi:hypothetical protein
MIAIMLAGIVIIGSDPAAVAHAPRLGTVMQVADQQTPALVKRRRPVTRHGRYYVVEEYPVACEAVRFPQSPLCAGRPFHRSWYAGIEW